MFKRVTLVELIFNPVKVDALNTAKIQARRGGGRLMSGPNSLGLNFGPRHTIRQSNKRLMRLIVQLFFVVFLFSQVARPEFWATWLGAIQPEKNAEIVPGTRLIEPENKLPQMPAGMFIAQALPENRPKAAQEKPGEPRQKEQQPPGMPVVPAGDDDSGPIRTPVEDLPFLLETLTDLDRDLPPALYYHFLDRARHAPTDRLIQDGRKDVTFAHLYKNPKEDPKKYRGQLISIAGTVRRAVAFDMPPNAYGLTKRYELWLFTEDSGKYPWVVELTELPAGFPIGTEIQEKIQTSGYFLKLWAYRAQDGFRSAPVLLGNGLTWTRTDQIRAEFDSQFRWLLGGFLGFFLIVLAIVIRKWRLEDLATRKSRGFDQLTDRFAEIPDHLDLNAGVLPKPKFDYIVDEPSETSGGGVGSPSQSLNRSSQDSQTQSDTEELHL